MSENTAVVHIPKKRERKVKGIRRGKGVGRILAPKSVELAQRRYQVVTLRTQGYTMPQICESLGITVQAARQDLIYVMKNTLIASAETTAENRQLQIERLDGLLRAYYGPATTPVAAVNRDGIPLVDKNNEPVMLSPDATAAALVLQIEARRAKLLALDVPETKVEPVSAIREYVGVEMDKV